MTAPNPYFARRGCVDIDGQIRAVESSLELMHSPVDEDEDVDSENGTIIDETYTYPSPDQQTGDGDRITGYYYAGKMLELLDSPSPSPPRDLEAIHAAAVEMSGNGPVLTQVAAYAPVATMGRQTPPVPQNSMFSTQQIHSIYSQDLPYASSIMAPPHFVPQDRAAGKSFDFKHSNGSSGSNGNGNGRDNGKDNGSGTNTARLEQEYNISVSQTNPQAAATMASFSNTTMASHQLGPSLVPAARSLGRPVQPPTQAQQPMNHITWPANPSLAPATTSLTRPVQPAAQTQQPTNHITWPANSSLPPATTSLCRPAQPTAQTQQPMNHITWPARPIPPPQRATLSLPLGRNTGLPVPQELQPLLAALRALPKRNSSGFPERNKLKTPFRGGYLNASPEARLIRDHFSSRLGTLREKSPLMAWYGDERVFEAKMWEFLVVQNKRGR